MDGVFVFLGFVAFFVVFGSFISVFIILGRTGTILEKVDAMQKKILLMANDLTQMKSQLNGLKSGDIPVVKPEEKKKTFIDLYALFKYSSCRLC